MKEKGMIVKIKGPTCVILTRDGVYKKVPLAGRSNARVGSEIEFTSGNWFDYLKPAMMVASLLIIVLGASLFHSLTTPEAFAYVSLDINPSLELAVSSDFKVLGVCPVNGDAEKILAGLDLKGLDLYTCINTILAKSAQEGYLKPGQKNYVLSTITVNENAVTDTDTQTQAQVNYEAFTENLSKAVTSDNVDIELMILSSDQSTRTEAKKQGLSTGKLAFMKGTAESGEKITVDQVKESSVTELVNVYKIKQLPNDKKLIIKSVHIPPGQKKRMIDDAEDSGKQNDLRERDHRKDDDDRDDRQGEKMDVEDDREIYDSGKINKEREIKRNDDDFRRNENDDSRDQKDYRSDKGKKPDTKNNSGDERDDSHRKND